MKKSLLLLFACLFGALNGVKAWTGVNPKAGKSYYLLSTTHNQLWYASSVALGNNRYYGVTSDISRAIPIYVESVNNNNYSFSFYLGQSKYFMNESSGNTSLSGSRNFEVAANGDKYYIYAEKHGAKYRCLNAEGSNGTCNFPDFDSKNAGAQWQFIAVEEVWNRLFEKVTSVEMLKNNPENYFFVIQSADNSSLMVRTDAYEGQGFYRNISAPLSSSEYLFNIENYIYDHEDYFVMKAENTSAYYYPKNGAPWLFAPSGEKNSADDDCRLIFTNNDGKWDIKTHAVWGGSNWGLWYSADDSENYQGYIDGQSMAGNKTADYQGSFYIYRIPKYNLDMTNRIVNPSFETGNDFGWIHGNSDDTGVKSVNQENNKYAMSGSDGSYLFNIWWQGKPMTQNIGTLPAGQYKLSAITTTDQNAKTYLKVNGGHNDGAVSTGGGNTGVLNEYSFAFNSATEATIGVVGCASDHSSYLEEGYHWYKADNFHLTYYGTPATDADYTDLENAIRSAESKTLGFDNGEYAPYNNVAVLNALAAAKAIDKNANNQQALIQSAIRAIADKNWMANSSDVEAVYNGNFAEGQGSPAANIQQYGWTRTNNWGQFQNNVYGSTTGYYNQAGSLQYGNAGQYTMPLKANTIYRLQFKYNAWDGGTQPTASVLNAEEGMAAKTFASTTQNYKDGLIAVDMLFATGSAGNYILTLAGSYNIVFTGVSITKAASQTLTFADNAIPTYAPGTYPSVSYTRSGITLNKNKYATIFLPYSFSTDGLKVMEYTSSEGDVLTFTPVTETVANTPYLVRVADDASDEDVTSLTFSGSGAVSAASGTSGEVFIGTYSPVTLKASVDGYNYYGFSAKNGDFRQASSSGNNCGAFRAYVKLPAETTSARVALRFDDGTTGIATLDANGNINGAEVMKDGKYFENGKIVIVKNGVKYGTNGQKLN